MNEVTIHALISSCGGSQDGPGDPNPLMLTVLCAASSRDEQSGPPEQVTVRDLQHWVPQAFQVWLGHLECSLWEQSAALNVILFEGGKKLPEKINDVTKFPIQNQSYSDNVSVKIFHSLQPARKALCFSLNVVCSALPAKNYKQHSILSMRFQPSLTRPPALIQYRNKRSFWTQPLMSYRSESSVFK